MVTPEKLKEQPASTASIKWRIKHQLDDAVEQANQSGGPIIQDLALHHARMAAALAEALHHVAAARKIERSD